MGTQGQATEVHSRQGLTPGGPITEKTALPRLPLVRRELMLATRICFREEEKRGRVSPHCLFISQTEHI